MFLGFLATPLGISPVLEKVEAISKMQPPLTVWHFLGATGFFLRHMEKHTTLTAINKAFTKKKI